MKTAPGAPSLVGEIVCRLDEVFGGHTPPPVCVLYSKQTAAYLVIKVHTMIMLRTGLLLLVDLLGFDPTPLFHANERFR